MGRENGPVTEEHFKQLIREGKVQAQTPVMSVHRTNGMWISAGSFEPIRKMLEKRDLVLAESKRKAKLAAEQMKADRKREAAERKKAKRNELAVVKAKPVAVIPEIVTIEEPMRVIHPTRSAKRRLRVMVVGAVVLGSCVAGLIFLWPSPQSKQAKKLMAVARQNTALGHGTPTEFVENPDVAARAAMRTVADELKTGFQTCKRMTDSISRTWHRGIFDSPLDFNTLLNVLMTSETFLEEKKAAGEVRTRIQAQLVEIRESIPESQEKNFSLLRQTFAIYNDFYESAVDPQGNYRTYLDRKRTHEQDLSRNFSELEIMLAEPKKPSL